MFATIYLISEWTIRIFMIPVVLRRRRPEAALAWLTAIFFLPLAGLIAYLLFGRQRLGRKRIDRTLRAHAEVATAERLAAQAAHVVRPRIAAKQHDIVAMAQGMGGSSILGGNRIEMLPETDSAIGRLIADIDAAEHHVHILVYIYRNDYTGKRVSEAMLRATARGVRCRLLVDAVGSSAFVEDERDRLRHAGIDMHPLMPVSPARLLVSRLDVRNHRKIAVIDGRIGYAGSQNIVDADYGHRKYGAWRDLMLRITGPSVLHLQQVFLEDWYGELGSVPADGSLFPKPETDGAIPIQIVPSGPAFESAPLQDLIVAAIHEAEKRIIITTPYFLPGEAAQAALRIGAARGVRVDLVIPARSNHPVVTAAGRSHVRELAHAGVHVHKHRSGLLHSKTMSIDDAFSLVGSSNFDIRSFDINFEVNLLLYGSQVTLEVRTLQERYIGESVPMDLAARDEPGPARRLRDDAARLLSPLL